MIAVLGNWSSTENTWGKLSVEALQSKPALRGRGVDAQVQSRLQAANRTYGDKDTRGFPPRWGLTVPPRHARTYAIRTGNDLQLGLSHPESQRSRSRSWRSPARHAERWCTLARPLSKRRDGHHKKALLTPRNIAGIRPLARLAQNEKPLVALRWLRSETATTPQDEARKSRAGDGQREPRPGHGIRAPTERGSEIPRGDLGLGSRRYARGRLRGYAVDRHAATFRQPSAMQRARLGRHIDVASWASATHPSAAPRRHTSVPPDPPMNASSRPNQFGAVCRLSEAGSWRAGQKSIGVAHNGAYTNPQIE